VRRPVYGSSVGRWRAHEEQLAVALGSRGGATPRDEDDQHGCANGGAGGGGGAEPGACGGTCDGSDVRWSLLRTP